MVVYVWIAHLLSVLVAGAGGWRIGSVAAGHGAGTGGRGLGLGLGEGDWDWSGDGRGCVTRGPMSDCSLGVTVVGVPLFRVLVFCVIQ